MIRFRAFLRPLLILIVLAGPVSECAAQEDLVIGFIVEADSIYQASGEKELSEYIQRRAPLVGAAVGTLLEIGFEVGMQGDAGPEAENVDFALLIARLHVDSGESEGPKTYVERYQRWSEQDRTNKLAAQKLEARAVEARQGGDYELALAKLAEAAALYEKIGDTRALAVLWGSRGIVHYYRSDFESMENVYARALLLRRKIDDRILVGKTLNGMGSVHMVTDRYAEAIDWYSQAVEMRRSTGDLAGLVTSLTYLGNVHYQKGELAEAASNYEAAESVLRPLGQEADRQRFQLLNSRASVEKELGHFKVAMELYRHALTLNLQMVDNVSTVSNRLNLAELLTIEGRYQEAMRELELCEPLLEVEVTVDYIVDFYIRRSEVYAFVGDIESARDDLAEARRLAQEYEMRYEQIEVMVDTAALYIVLAAPDRALALAVSAAEMAEEAEFDALRGRALSRSGDAAQALGDASSALLYYRETVELYEAMGNHKQLIASRIGMAHALAVLERNAEAREVYSEVLLRAEEAGEEWLLPEVFIGFAHSYEEEDPALAREYYSEALEALDDLRTAAGERGSTTFFVNESGYYFQEIARYYAGLHVEDPEGVWAAEALSVTEKAKARGLLDQIGGGEAQLATLDELQDVLPENKLLLQYALGDSASFLWSIDRDDVELVELPPKEQLRTQVERLRTALASPEAGDARLLEASRSLYQSLLEPVRAQLDSAENLVIVPDAALYLLPFELLLEEDPNDGEGFSEHAFLGRSYSTSYAPSSSVWLRLSAVEDHPSQSQLTAVGNPDFSTLEGVDLADLPYSLQEVERVGQRADPDQSELLLGAAATETALRRSVTQRNPLILHLATHGLVDPAEPDRSCVALTADEENDGFLYSKEIEELRPAAALVVLSACETATGRLRRGEGVVGLGRSFLASGAHGVVASLWPVSDESTAVLMDSFYENLFGGKGAAESLTLARRTLLADEAYSHPYHWAAFILVGDAAAPWIGR